MLFAQSESAAELNTALLLIVSSEPEISGNVDERGKLGAQPNSVGSSAVPVVGMLSAWTADS